MEKRGFLLILVLLFSVFFVIAACPVGRPAHGVTICGINYNCGNGSDGVCPMYFGANCTDWANACYHPDPNCPSSCEYIGGSAGNIYCALTNASKPVCCGTGAIGSGHCEVCCGSNICNTTRAPAASPGALYNTNGYYSCQAQCNLGVCNYAANCTDCRTLNGWYNTTTIPTTQWVNSTNVCQLQLQVYQENRSYTASGTNCTYIITGNRWLNVSGAISNKTAGTVCKVDAGMCEANDVCNGGVCVPTYAPASTVCRPVVGLCDVAENCTGSSATCPSDSFAPSSRQCNSAWACSQIPGDNLYNSGGAYICQGYCDGITNSCDFANNCTNCGSSGCSDADTANNPYLRSNITLAGGCSAGVCTSSSVVWDYCSGSSTQEVTCAGPSQGVTLSYDCNINDTSNCWCAVAAPNLNQVCDDWGCSGGRCNDTGSDWTSNTWACVLASQCANRLCPPTSATSYRCYRSNTGSWTWSTAALASEAACADSYDNDCDGWWDYDTDNRGPGGISPHGDDNCPVSINSPEVPASASPSQTFSSNITPIALVNSISAKISETGSLCTFNRWEGSKAVFNCIAPAAPGTYTVLFYVNTSKSYQTGPNRTGTVTVAPTSCTGLSQPVCTVTPGCEWCANCSGRLSNGLLPPTSLCVDINTCGRQCVAGQCTATCDLSTGCASTCTGNIRNYRVCNATCSCQIDWTEDCNLKNCTTNAVCLGLGTPTLSLTGDRYVCAPGLTCQTSGTTTCNSSVCTVIGQTWICNGNTYYCVFNETIIVWNETMPTTEICDDGVDNNGDGLTDCQDTISCSPDTTAYCCNVTRCTDTTTSPADNGISYGPNLFDAPGNLGTPPNCCGNNANEWYWNIGGGACCDQSSDCVNASGACFNNNTPLVEAHKEHCINHVWYDCNYTVINQQRGTYYCTYDPSNGGWGWRTFFPAENCTDTWPGIGAVDNDNDGQANCLDADCAGNCAYGCGVPEGIAFLGTCTDGKDNNCDGLIDAQNGSACPEGSSNATNSPFRMCWDGGSNEVAPLNDLPDSPLIDLNDDGCCDLCSGGGMYFDTDGGVRIWCGTPICNCGSLTFSATGWDTGTTPYCCGNNANEFYRTNPSNPGLMGCCNASAKCVDDTGTCRAGVEETEALCMDSIDNDCDDLVDCRDTNCSGGLMGRVTDERGRGVAGAIIQSSPPGKPDCESSAPTDSNGDYAFDALIGSYNIIARKPGYDDNVTWVTVVPKQVQLFKSVNFTLRNGTCHADCTDSYGNCNPACDGLSFTNSTGGVDYCSIIPICANRPKGFRATEVSGSDIIEYTCCEGQTNRTYPVKKAEVTGDMENLYVYKTVVKLGLKYVTLNIAYWYPVQ